ncbi:MAG: GH92 family glycosyl hydrolase [Bacteroidales bacterium]|nr:GH92 family glycosyl hydrolase [Bacteroidales bacterium]MBR0264212.1 GH92 family glycosyl hydrolase [Prevotella sp.]
MKTKLFSALCAVLAVAACSTPDGNKDRDLVSYVDPYIGSGGHGHVFVGASVPFGAVQLGPTDVHTGWDWCSGYHYSDSVVIGFSHTHLSGTGCADLCDINLMPFTGPIRTQRADRRAKTVTVDGTTSAFYGHDKESVAPGYYSVSLGNNVDVELTATERVGLHHYSYKDGEERRLLIDLEYGNDNVPYDTYIKKIDGRTVEGWRMCKGWSPERKVYFYAKFNQDIESFLTFTGDTRTGNDELRVQNPLDKDLRLYRLGREKAEGVKAVATFSAYMDELMVKVAISSVSCDNAKANMEAEMPDWNFDAVKQAARDKWNTELSRVEATGTERQKRIFYTSLFHMMIEPQLYCDVNGEYLGLDGQVHKSNGKNYTTLSTWDTYRTLHPLFTIIQRDRVPDMVNTMLAICRQQNLMPIWPLQGGETYCMPGTSSIPIVADACLKGIEGIDPKESLECMLLSAAPDSKRPTNTPYKDLGYLPDEEGRVSSCLENAVDDWAIALLAKKLGRQDIYEEFMAYGHYFENYWDASINKIRPRLRSGEWLTPYNPCAVREKDGRGHFTEGNGWQYTFMAPQSPEDLIRLHGSDEAFVQNLDSLFVAEGDLGGGAADVTGLIGMYAHGNEPSHQTVYLYSFAGQPWKTAQLVNKIQKELYTDQPDGLSGNEDCGQMSAWHVQSALGFFQVNPAGGDYVFGTPLFPKVVLNLPGGKTFTVIAKGVSDSNIYIKGAKLNGKEYTKSYITYDDIMAGGTLEFSMSGKPNENFGKAPADRPVSAR